MRLSVIIATLSLFISGSVSGTSNPVASDEQKTDHGLRVLPLPTQYTTGQDVLCLSPHFEIQLDPSLKGRETPEDMRRAIKRTEEGLWTNRHQYLSIQRGAEFFPSDNLKDGCRHSLRTLRISVEGDDEIKPIMNSAIRPAEERPDLERYTLSVPLSGPAVLKAPTALGVLRGLTTFENLFYYLSKPQYDHDQADGDVARLFDPQMEQNSQLFITESQDDGDHPGSGARGHGHRHGIWYAPTAPYEIEDKPAFGWRAVMLDTSRNWFSKKSIFKVSPITIFAQHPCEVQYEQVGLIVKDARYNVLGQGMSSPIRCKMLKI